MRCIILAAGYGTRLYPLSKNMAKALLPIRGKPIIEYIVNKIETQPEISEILIVVNDRFFKDFKEWLDNFSNSIPVKLLNDGSRNHKDRLGAIKDLHFVASSEALDEDVLVVGGDNLFDFSLSDFIQQSVTVKENPLIGIYDLNGKTKANKFGIVQRNKEGKIIDFLEKPQKANGSKLVSLCLYYMPKYTLHLLKDYLNSDNDKDSIGNYIKWLVKNHEVYGHEFQGNWLDIGDIDSYTEAICSF